MSKAEQLEYVINLNNSKDLKHLEYLGENLQKIQVLARELQETGKLTELTQFEKCVSTLSHVAISTTRNVISRIVNNVIMSKVFIPLLSSIMSGLKPIIRQHVDKSVRENIDKEKLKFSDYEDVQNILKEIRESLNYETIGDIFKEATLKTVMHCSDWRVQLGAVAIDQYISWTRVYNYAKDLCKKINDKLKLTSKSINPNIDELINQLIERLSEEIYSCVVSTTIKTCEDVYSVGRSAYKNYIQEKQAEADCMELIKDFKEGGQAGQEHVKALSYVIKRPIHICEENGNTIIIGPQYLGVPIKVRYFPGDESSPTGHYVPFDEDKSWSSNNNSENNCLFDAIGTQIQKDLNELRNETIKQLESDPTRYIAPHTRSICGTELLLEGGSRNLIFEQHYPSHENRIKVAKGHMQIHAELRNTLNEEKQKIDRFNGMTKSNQIRHEKCNKSIPQFGTIPGKEEMMMGSLSVTFTDGSKLQLLTVSGDDRFSLRQSDSGNTITWKIELRGFEFIDSGKPEGKIYDVYNRHETDVNYNRSCAAQKLLHRVGEHMKQNPNLVVKGDLKMAESWYKPGNAKYSPNQVAIIESCRYCEQILPIATGSSTNY